MRILARLLLWTLVLAVAVVAAGIIAVVLIDPDDYKGWIASKFHERTGRTLSLDGDVAVTLYPWLGLEVNEAGMGNAPGFGDAPFLQVDHAKVRVKLLPLLRGRYEVDTVHVRGAVINLARDEQGVSNWDDLVGGDAPKTEDEAGTGDAPGRGAPALPLSAVALGGVAVEDARITWEDRQAAVRHDVSDLNVSTDALEYGKPIDLVLSFHGTSGEPAIDASVNMKGVVTYETDGRQYGISPLEASARIVGRNVPGGETTATLSAGIGIDLDAGTASVSDLRIDVLETSIEGRLDASRIESPAPSINTTVNVKGSDLALLFKVAEVEPLASQLAGLEDRSFQAGAAVDADLEQGNVNLSGLSATLLGATVTGEVEARGVLSRTPAYRGRLDARGPDLPTLMQVAGQLQGGGDSVLVKYGKKLSDGPVKTFDVKADFDADSKTGDVSVPALSIDALGISATGALEAKGMRTGKGTVSGNLKVRGDDVSGLLMAFGQAGLARTLQSLELETRVQGTRSGISLAPLALAATFAGEGIPDSPAKVTLDVADAGIDLDKETLVLDRLALHGLGLEMAGRLDASRIGSPAPSINTTVNVKGSDLALLFKVAEVEPLASQLAGLEDRSFQAGAAVDADLERGNVHLSGLSATLLGATVTGEVEARGVLSRTPAYRGRLDARGPDLPTLMQVAGQLQGGGDSVLVKYGKKLSDGPVKTFDVKADFDADSKTGDVSVPALSIDALGISATGALEAKGMRTGKGTVSGNLKVRGDDVSGLLMAFGQAGLARTLQSLELETRVQGTRSGISLAPLALAATFAGEGIPDSPAKVTLDVADAGIDLDKETLILDRLALHGLGLEMAGNASMAGVPGTPTFDAFSGRLDVRPFNLRELAGRLEMKLPATAGAKTLTRVALSGRFDGTGTDLNLNDLALRVDDSELTGEFKAAGTIENPAVQFNLEVDEIDLDRYMPSGSAEPPAKQGARRAGKDGGTEGGRTAAAGFIGIPVDTIRGLNVDGTLNAGKLIVSNAKLEKVGLRLSAKDGVVTLGDLSAELYQGRFSGGAALDVNPEAPALTVDSSLQGIHVEPLLEDVAGGARVRGKGDVSAALSAEGGSVEAMKRSLNGRMSVSFSDGAIVGMNVGEHLQRWKDFDKSRSVAFKRTETTEFSTLTGNLVAKDGIVRLDDLKTDALAFHLTGKGVLADLHADTIDYEVLATVANVTGGTGGGILSKLIGIELPIHVRGSLARPEAKMDWGEALASLLVPPILDVLPLPIPLLNEPEDGADGKPGSNSTGNLLEKGLKSIFGE